MDLHLFVNGEYPAGIDIRSKVEDHVRQAKLAQDCGFVGVAVGQHLSLGDLQWFPPIPFLSYIAGRCPDLSLSMTVGLLPYFNPFLLAESVAFLDVLTNGKMNIGLAAGWANVEFRALDVDHDRRIEIFEERIQQVDSLLRGRDTEMSDSAEHRVVRLGLLPIRKPRPPIWIGASSVGIARRLAPLGDTIVMSAHVPLDKQIAIKAAFVKGKDIAEDQIPDVPVIRNVFVAPTRAEALRLAMPYLEASYSKFDELGLFTRVLHEQTTREALPDKLQERVIIGDAEDVAHGLQLTSDRLGTKTLILRMQWRGMSSEYVETSIKLIGDAVQPLLQD